VHHFLEEFSKKRGDKLEASPEAMRCLIAYDYPGNVRELKNIIERISVLAPEQVIKPDDLPSDLTGGNGYDNEEDTFSLSQTIAKTEKQLILKALAQTKGKKGEAAELLGISRKNLWEKIKLYQIT
jgi:two-component system response regulator AtoC